jgi:hypothetical protein
MYYQGNPVTDANPLPCSLGDGTVTITGDVTIPAVVNVYSSPEEPVHVHVSEQIAEGSNTIGRVNINGTVPVSLNQLAPGSNTIGNVNINGVVPVSLNQLASGSNTIGNVNINGVVPVSLNQLAPGSNTIGNVNVNGRVPVSFNQLAPGSNTIGSVNVNYNSSNVSATNALPVSVINVPTTYILPFNGLADAFGKIRTSGDFTLGDYKHTYGADPNFLDYTSNGGTVSFVKNKACCTLTTSNISGSRVIHQTRCYHPYMPGKSHLILSSMNFQGFTSNVIKRTGYYDDQDGIFFEVDGTKGSNLLSVNIRSYVTGTAVDNKVYQSSWNFDKLDGTGPSGYTLDITKTQLFYTDFQWLGVGRVRTGFVIGGVYTPIHEFNHANYIANVYMTNPTLPVRCEIINASSSPYYSGTMDQICSTVISEGGYLETGTDAAILSGIRTITTGLGNYLPVACIALKNSFNGYKNRNLVKLAITNVFSLDENVSYAIYILDSTSNVVGGSWVDLANSAVQYNITATSLSSFGNMIANGFVTGGSSGQKLTSGASTAIGSSTKRNYIATNIDATDSSVYAVVCTTLTANATNVSVGLQWREIN